MSSVTYRKEISRLETSTGSDYVVGPPKIEKMILAPKKRSRTVDFIMLGFALLIVFCGWFAAGYQLQGVGLGLGMGVSAAAVVGFCVLKVEDLI